MFDLLFSDKNLGFTTQLFEFCDGFWTLRLTRFLSLNVFLFEQSQKFFVNPRGVIHAAGCTFGYVIIHGRDEGLTPTGE